MLRTIVSSTSLLRISVEETLESLHTVEIVTSFPSIFISNIGLVASTSLALSSGIPKVDLF